jgi:hypothetical protein
MSFTFASDAVPLFAGASRDRLGCGRIGELRAREASAP